MPTHGPSPRRRHNLVSRPFHLPWLRTAQEASILLLLFLLSRLTGFTQTPAPGIEFNRDIRPILSDNCFYCHGPDAGHRKGKLRLDVREDAISRKAIVPGHPEQSQLLLRIHSGDKDEIMPPPDSNKRLGESQKQTLSQWIREGARYQAHWSYEKPARANSASSPDVIDSLVLARANSAGLVLSPPANRRILIRRLYADLLGLPPTPEEVNRFQQDPGPDAYERLVMRTLERPEFGERMAIGWLDVVRYADTIGYHSDTPRNVWPYRDWVIQSFNRNKPFDRFTREQIAGDLLPDANQETRVGSAFNRLLLSTEEGGAQPRDYEARMLADRVRAIGTAWLGQTTGCAQCHDHKFDPFTLRDFYSLGAFFADVREQPIGRREEGMLVLNQAQQAGLDSIEAALREATRRLDAVAPQLDREQREWEMELQKSGRPLENEIKEKAALAALRTETSKRTPKQAQALRDYFRNQITRSFAAEREQANRTARIHTTFLESAPRCLVTESSTQKRTVRILPRGNWMDDSGDVVQPAFPGYLPKPDTGSRTLTRLDLADWLVSRDNPLTARTFVNRLWRQFFGTGLSKVLDDLGAQGEPPPNGPLLDWLACEFMDSGWNVKHMVRLIVTSQTYRQGSAIAEFDTSLLSSTEIHAASRNFELAVQVDPWNRQHARQSRFRLDAELIRDNALFAGGLLSPQIGGPSAKPYQPAGYWENLNFPIREYIPDTGPNQYRRGLYTWWQRTFLHPALLAFDAPSREECTAERSRSNIPQQALTLLNDPSFVEASIAFAGRILQSSANGTDSSRLTYAWELALQRHPTADELRTALTLLEKQRASCTANPDSIKTLLQNTQLKVSQKFDPIELAVWTHLARVLLNLHETITRS